MKIDRNSLPHKVPEDANAPPSAADFKAVLSRAERDASTLSSAAGIRRQKGTFSPANDAGQAPVLHAPGTAEEFRITNKANAIDSDPGTNPWYRVRIGDTLSDIVSVRLRSLNQTASPQTLARLTRTIAQSSQISNPDRIFPGQKINLAPLGNAKSAILEIRLAPSPKIEMPPTADATTSQALHFKNAMQVEVAPTSESPLNTVPVSRTHDGNAEPYSASRDMINAYAPDQLQDCSNGSFAVKPCLDNATDKKAAARSLEISIAKEKQNSLPDILYKGVIGKALDTLPINPEMRTTLQQTNAIVSGSMAGRSFAAMTGLASPVLALAGLIWGIFSAKNIGAAATESKATPDDTKTAKNSMVEGKPHILETSALPGDKGG